jgi:hypothetical protein
MYHESGKIWPDRGPEQRERRFRAWRRFGLIGCGGLVFIIASLATCGFIIEATQPHSSQPAQVVMPTIAPMKRPTPTAVHKRATPTVTPAQRATPTIAPTATPTPTPKPTATPRSIWPPRTLADLHALAARGDAGAIHEFHSQGEGLATCPQPERDVTVDQSVTGEQLASDLLAYFYAQGLDNDCGSVVFAYHDQSEVGNGYTAGRVMLKVDVGKHVLTLDIGDISGPEYAVEY